MNCKVKFGTDFRRERSGQDLPGGERQNRMRWPRIWHLLVAGLWIQCLFPSLAQSAELIMFEAPYCEWCEAWDDEVGVVYAKTSEGRLAPLRRISIHEPRPPDLAPIAGVLYSPTFVLLDRGHEVGRIVGYPGEDHFWGLLQVLLDELPQLSGPQAFGDM
jgi:hypothetical protein